MRPWEVRKLTPYQLTHVYFHERGEHGEVLLRAEGDDSGAPSDEERVKARWRGEFGLTDAQAEVKWREFLKAEAYRDALERQRPALEPAEIERRVKEYERGLIRDRAR